MFEGGFEDWKPLKETNGRIQTLQTLTRRSQTEIALDVLLTASQGPIRPTRIMYAANLGWSLTQAYLKVLAEEGLIEQITLSPERARGGFKPYLEGKKRKGPSSVWQITQKGMRAAAAYREAKQLLGRAAIQTVSYDIGEKIPTNAGG